LAGLLVVAACSSSTKATTRSSAAGAAKTISVVTTTPIITDFVRVIGGDRVEVRGLVTANVDPHAFEPSPADIDALAKADVIVRNGVGLEKWFDDAVRSASPRGTVVDASDGVTLRHESGTEADPHIWHDPTNALKMVTSIEGALAKADSAGAAYFQQNLAAYKVELTKLDADAKARIATLTNKKLVTNHDAFGYYIDHYGLDLVGSIIPSFDTSAELSAQEIADIVTKIKESGTKAVFSETSLPAKTAEAIGSEAGVRVVAGDDALYGDSLGPAGSDGDTYLKMEAHNTRIIVDNLS
jgi:zinc/manganese transport system substrate-binding protein/manganese/iron transport system substrate-binding protein